jgi:hypothetical protein
MITDLSHNIDGILRALQVIQVSVEGITASYDSTTPFIVRSHLTATAHELSGLDGSRLRATGRLMMLMTVAKAAEGDKLIHVRGGHRLLKGNLRDADTPSILDEMQRLTSYCMNIQSAAKLISSQPRLCVCGKLAEAGPKNSRLVTHRSGSSAIPPRSSRSSVA